MMRLLSKDINHRIGQAMHSYNMLADGDRVLIAVSGGVDSLFLAWLLKHWERKAPIGYEILAVHLDMGFGADEYRLVAEQLALLGIPHLVEQTDFGKKAVAAEDGKSICYHCTRQRRNRLFHLAAQKNFNKIAFGHHQDDLLETFFLNLLYGGNLSTMVPRQDLFQGKISLIRPLAFLEKKEIARTAAALHIHPVKNPCPQDTGSKRQEIRNLLKHIYSITPGSKNNIFAAMSNIREGYLLKKPGALPQSNREHARPVRTGRDFHENHA